MACEGCPTHNFGSGRIPTGADDPCNTSGDGIFCPGSFWLYDGSDPNFGTCELLFQRTGDTCGVDEWLKISLDNSITSGDAPTITDCCPAGTIWIRPDALSGLGYDEVYMSYADFSVTPPVCRWCLICTTQAIADFPNTISVAASAVSGEIILDDLDGNPATDLPDGPPQTSITGLVPATAMITNPSLTRSMTVQIVWTGYEANFFFQTTNLPFTGVYSVQPYFFIDGVLQNNPFATDAVYHRVGVQGNSTSSTHPTNSWTATVTIAPGANLQASIEAGITAQISHNGADLAAQVGARFATVSIQGVLI